uniref:Oxysterol-binding protein n=1 Tax=Parascaris univalens TaxID=6257 RepID=A0A915B9Y3_PARUN
MTLKKRLRNARRHLGCITRPRRNQSEVGQSCRGSINLQEARIHTDTATNSLTISASSQTFHLKAQNECDRKQWLTALEYARHRAIRAAESDEDEDVKMDSCSNGGMAALETMNKALAAKLDDLRTCNSLIAKHGGELVRALNETEINEKTRLLSERISLFKITAAAMVNASDEFVTMIAKESRKVGRYAANEHEQRLRLQDQLEELAQQHSSLERAAYRTARESDLTSDPPFFESDEEFHDASDKMNDLRYDDRKSNSSHTGSLCEDADRELFDAEIVTPSAAFEQFNTESRPSIVQIDQSVAKRRRSRIPDRPQVSLNLWSIMRNCIGKELSKIPMPVNFNEPLSVLQRISEDLEYSHLLDTAAECSDPLEQMCYIAAYAVSSYSTTGNRTTKPFNPLLGETFECDRSSDLGWKSLAEQVSHHPPITAHHADGRKWIVHQDFTMTSRFRGKYLSVIPVGYSHVKFLHQKNEYSFKKVTTTVHNIIVGKLWIDNHGEMVIDNHITGDKCFLKFHPYSYFSREIPRKVTGLVKDNKGKVQWIIQGTWDRSLDMLKVVKDSDVKGEKSVFETGPPRRMWTVNPPYPGCEKMYYFTRLAIELNEMEEGVAPTDSRLRPDQRLMEEGKWDDANRLKVQIEEKQRAVRRHREALAEKALQSGEPFEEYQPLWFKKTQHEQTGAVIHMFTGEYWEKKKLQDWSMCPNIF